MAEEEDTAMAIAGMSFAFGFLTLATVIAVVVIIQMFSTRRARAAIAREAAYQELAEASAKHQQAISAALADVQARVVVMEKLLRDV